MDITIGIKLPVGNVAAKPAMRIKQLTGLSLSDIANRVANDNYIVECSVTDDEGLHLINKLKREMRALEIPTRLYEGGREEPSELFDNLEQLNKELEDDLF